MKRTAALLAFLASLSTGCASHLSVRTEIYDGEGLITGKAFPARAAERARATAVAVDGLDAAVVAPMTDEFVRTIATIAETVPDAVSGGAEGFRTQYVTAIRDRALRPLQPEIDRVRAEAKSIEAKALAGAGNESLRADLVEM